MQKFLWLFNILLKNYMPGKNKILKLYPKMTLGQWDISIL